MLAAQAQSEIIGDNVANVRTPGYKRNKQVPKPFQLNFERLVSSGNGATEVTPLGTIGTGVIANRVSKINIQGVLQTTDKSTDLALSTPGFFVVQTPEGDRYTRNGQFQLNANGVLQTLDGNAVLGKNGPIGMSKPLSQQFKVTSDGTVVDDGQVIDHLRFVDIPDAALERQGQSLYSTTQAPQAGVNVQVRQGAFEASNVDLAGQMVQMITVMRAYEANQKVMQTQDATLEKAVNEVGKI